jgi:hypothetical protein
MGGSMEEEMEAFKSIVQATLAQLRNTGAIPASENAQS